MQVDRVVQLNDKNLGKRITWNIKTIRPDLFIGRDNRYNESFVALKPSITLELKPLGGNTFEAIFKKMF